MNEKNGACGCNLFFFSDMCFLFSNVSYKKAGFLKSGQLLYDS